MTVVTSGSKYMDIDAFASCFAFAKLLDCLGIEACVVSTAPTNESIIEEFIVEDTFQLNSSYHISESDTFALVDVSNPQYFEHFVVLDRVSFVIDHHYGFADYWNQKIGSRAKIEPIGAAVTIIFEEFARQQLLSAIDPQLSRLMMAAILDNTLNFCADITSERDIYAYGILANISNEPRFSEHYFSECQKKIERDFIEALMRDVKCVNQSVSLPRYVGQLAIWDVSCLLQKLDKIISVFSQYQDNWMLNVIALQEKRSYIIAIDNTTKGKLEQLFSSTFEGNTMCLDYPVLRKEFMRKSNSR